MTNLTLAIDDDVLRHARVRAVQEDTSVNAKVRDFLFAYAGGASADRPRQAMLRLIALAQSTPVGGGLSDKAWTRDDLHER